MCDIVDSTEPSTYLLAERKKKHTLLQFCVTGSNSLTVVIWRNKEDSNIPGLFNAINLASGKSKINFLIFTANAAISIGKGRNSPQLAWKLTTWPSLHMGPAQRAPPVKATGQTPTPRIQRICKMNLLVLSLGS